VGLGNSAVGAKLTLAVMTKFELIPSSAATFCLHIPSIPSEATDLSEDMHY